MNYELIAAMNKVNGSERVYSPLTRRFAAFLKLDFYCVDLGPLGLCSVFVSFSVQRKDRAEDQSNHRASE